MPQDCLRIQLFCGIRLILPDGTTIEELGPQSGALLARLALDPHHPHSREELIDYLWPEDEDIEEGRRRLRQLVFGIRKTLESAGADPDCIFLSTRGAVQLNPERVTVDAIEFTMLLRRAAAAEDLRERVSLYESAVLLYEGDLAPGYYQDLLLTERSRFHDECYYALLCLSRAREELGEIDPAIQAARRALLLDPAGEDAHCHLMRYYACRGELSSALRQYREMERTLRDELDTEPSLTARNLLADLREVAEIPRPVMMVEVAAASALQTQKSAAYSPVPARLNLPRKIRRRPRTRFLFPPLALLLIIMTLRSGPDRQGSSLGAAQGMSYPRSPLWVTRFEKRPGDKDSEPTSIVSDPSGNTYVAGFIDTDDRDVDFIVIKYDVNGKQLWEYRYNGPGNDVDRARYIAVDIHGSVYITGDSDNGTGDDTWTRLAGLDFATIKLGPDGKESPTWPDIGYGVGVRRYNGPDNGEDFPKKLLLDESGGVYVMGYSYSRTGDKDYAIVKYDSSGRQVWTERYDSPAHDEDDPSDIVLVPDGSLYLTGCSRLRPASGPEFDFQTIRYRQADGKKLWERRWGQGNHSDDGAKYARIGPRNSVFIMGEGRTAPGTLNHKQSGYVFLMYDPSGKLHRVRGARDQDYQVESLRGAEGYGLVFGDFGRTNRFLMHDETGRVAWVKDYRRTRAEHGSLMNSASRTHIYVVLSLPDVDGDPLAPKTDWVTLGFDWDGNIRREWFYRGNGNRYVPDTARAITVFPADLAPGKPRDLIFVAGQSTGDGSRDIVTLCYSSH